MPPLRIVAYALCYNEEILLPHYLKHYLSFCDKIVIYDNHSTDRSLDIIRSTPKVELRFFESNNEFDELTNMAIKNNCYKEEIGKADFCIVGDIDELLYARNIRYMLLQCKLECINFPNVTGYEMVGDGYPITDNIIEEIKYGVYSIEFSKRVIFSPQIDINFTPGCHFCKPKGKIHESNKFNFSLLHFKYLSSDYIIKRTQTFMPRISKTNKIYGFSTQYYNCLPFRIQEAYNRMRSLRKLLHLT